ncbi:hypothetical protein [Actinoplanes sp. LAM7112]|uniref:hypothetical protein n=1 Tax=Actinoplanes solisilvae TaxID=2486853 RepID=UPI00196B1446
MAGVTAAAYLVPQVLAYATLAGLFRGFPVSSSGSCAGPVPPPRRSARSWSTPRSA